MGWSRSRSHAPPPQAGRARLAATGQRPDRLGRGAGRRPVQVYPRAGKEEPPERPVVPEQRVGPGAAGAGCKIEGGSARHAKQSIVDGATGRAVKETPAFWPRQRSAPAERHCKGGWRTTRLERGSGPEAGANRRSRRHGDSQS